MTPAEQIRDFTRRHGMAPACSRRPECRPETLAHAADCAFKLWADRAFGRAPSDADDSTSDAQLRPESKQ